MSWLAVILLTLGAAGQRLIGMYLVGSKLDRRPVLRQIAELLPVAVVVALIAQLTVGDGRSITLDTRLIGVAVAIVLVWRRAPFIVVVLGAVVTTAAVRAVI
ncbi:MAG: AzlD domain-containing protein [Actinomycetota bacterium]